MNITTNQIDYIMVNKKFRSFITWACIYPGAQMLSAYVLLLQPQGLTKYRRNGKCKKSDAAKLKNKVVQS